MPSALTRFAARAVGELIMFFARAVTGVRPIWRGTLPSHAQRIYFANHGSHGDFVLIWTTLPGPQRAVARPVAGRDYWEASPLRRFIGRNVFNALLIDRQPAAPAHPEAAAATPASTVEAVPLPVDMAASPLPAHLTTSPVDAMLGALSRGESLILFPEGTRNTTDAPLLPFKSGLFHLGRRCAGVELVPVWIDNIRRVIPKGQYLPVPMVCSVSYGAPLQVGADEEKAAFLARAEAAVLALRPPESIAP